MRNTLKIAVSLSVLLGLGAFEANAGWGPRSQQAIASTSVQVVMRNYADAFRAEDVSYERDMLRGFSSNPQVLNPNADLGNEAILYTTIANEIYLLRRARSYGMGGYFYFRMGVLGALVADRVLPYALDYEPDGPEETLLQRIALDIDGHVASYHFLPKSDSLTYVRVPRLYFQERLSFYDQAKKMIALDYQQGKGYDGYLKEGGEHFFNRAVQTVSDVWNTVLRVEGLPFAEEPSREAVTWYLVDEIKYQLLVKGNPTEANKTYAYFVNTNPGIMQAYENVGDFYYVAGLRERGVQEWKIAYNSTGIDRQRIAEKLSKHYLAVGDVFFDHASGLERTDTDLNDALEAYTLSLKYDRNNQQAARDITETRAAIKAREERLQLAISIISSAESVMAEGDRSQSEGRLANAIDQYQQAVALFDTIDDEFADQARAATQGQQAARRAISDIIELLLDQAEETISQADRLVDEQRFDEAMERYRSIETIVNSIPGDESATTGKQRMDMIKRAQEKMDRAVVEKKRYQQQQQAAQAGQPAGGN
jgi:hypothetical protein